MQENLGPSEEADADFARELAKLVTESSAESRKVDKRTALAMWDSTVMPPAIRKKRSDSIDEGPEVNEDGKGIMNFTVVTKRGNKPQVSATASAGARFLNAFEDSATGRAINSTLGGPHAICPTARQGRAATSETACSQLRTTRRS